MTPLPTGGAPRGRFFRLLVPSLTDVFFAALLVAAFVRPGGLESLLADGDTGWHIRTGDLVLNTGHVPVNDPFSFSRAGQPWVAWEWLSDVVLAQVCRWGGLSAVAALAGVVLTLAAMTLLMRLLRAGAGLWTALAATMAAVSASSVHYLARPHVFSLLFYTLALWVAAEDRQRRRWWLWLLVPLTALWANLHGGFVAWPATAALLACVYAARRDWTGMRRYGALAAFCLAASLFNPYGWELHRHILSYLNSPWILDHVLEFQSPHIRSEGMVVFALLLLGSAAMVSRADPWDAAVALVWGFAALRSARHVPFFAIAAAPVLAAGCASLWKAAVERVSRSSPVSVMWELGQDLGRSPRSSLWLPVAAVALAVFAPAAAFPDSRFPVRAVEQNLSRLAPGSGMPRVLTSDQWADYLIYRLYPGQRVFFDGRSDFFGPEIGADYRKLLGGDGPWPELLDRYGFQLALLPRDWTLSTSLAREPGWRRVYQDPVAVLYARQEAEGGTSCISTGGF